jgi:hypothetical protein
MQILVVSLLVFTAYFANAFMDKSSENKFKNPKLNKGKTWEQKYATGLISYTKVWYYPKFYKPNFKEKFMFSTTFLSFLTDPWHFAKFIFMCCIKLCFFILGDWQILAIAQLAQWIGFTLGYDIILKRFEK